MNESLIEYLIQMGAMEPEKLELLRRQSKIDELRKGAMESPQGQMIGKHYVAPSITQGLAQLGKGLIASEAQKQYDKDFRQYKQDVSAGLRGRLGELQTRQIVQNSPIDPRKKYYEENYGDAPFPY